MGQLPILLATLALFNPGRDSSLRNLIHNLRSDLEFDYVLLLGNSDPIWQEILLQLPVPIVQIREMTENSEELGDNHSHNILTIAFIYQSSEETLKLMHSYLRKLNTTPILLVLKEKSIKVKPLLEWCWNHQLLNVVAIGYDFEESMIVYSYTPFPILQFIERPFENSTKIFEPRLENLHGYELPVAIGGSAPRLIVYRGKDGKLKISGPVGNLKYCIEQRFNCRLVQQYFLNESFIFPAQQYEGAVRNGSVEFALAAYYPKPPFSRFTYPIELMSWCLMMPVPQEVPHSQLYSMVFSPSAFLITLLVMVLTSLILSFALRLHGYRVDFSEYILHDSCLRGVMSQPFYEVFHSPFLVKGIYLGICVFGVLITAAYNSVFSTYMTSAPKFPPFTSYETIKHSNVKVVIWTPEYEMLLETSKNMETYKSIYRLEPNYTKFLELRDSFDPRYGYMMPLEKWSLVNQQQKVFSSPLFNLKEDLCVYHTVPIVFAIMENSIFKEPLNRLIIDLTAMGLFNHWRDMVFTDLIRAGKLELRDLSPPHEFRPMKVEDLEKIWIMVGVLLSLATFVFLLECIRFYRLKIIQKIKSVFRRTAEL
ncbi:uncharacterized protein LOC108091591 [Drosophila ficusphila]|uniref:uncharacterized protein LOC108091591 n=1 Tax=Drosophila ficusphila TaxID=30025 RepID=UPI0007E6058A|nr:uncharacterized protein LOC108091591 [Drosophila ficusphila]